MTDRPAVGCAVPGCDRQATKAGVCQSCYVRGVRAVTPGESIRDAAVRTASKQRPWERKPERFCSVADCGRPLGHSAGHGLCHACLVRARRYRRAGETHQQAAERTWAAMRCDWWDCPAKLDAADRSVQLCEKRHLPMADAWAADLVEAAAAAEAGLMLRWWRLRNGLSLDQLGDSVGVSRERVRQVERTNRPTSGRAVRVALAERWDVPVETIEPRGFQAPPAVRQRSDSSRQPKLAAALAELGEQPDWLDTQALARRNGRGSERQAALLRELFGLGLVERRRDHRNRWCWRRTPGGTR